MTNTRLEKEEHPNYDDSQLFNDCASGSSAELCDAGATPVEHGACKDKADAVRKEDRFCLELLHGDEDVIRMVVDALCFVEWAWEQLCGNEKCDGEAHPKDAFPTHHVERLLSTRPLEDELFKNTL